MGGKKNLKDTNIIWLCGKEAAKKSASEGTFIKQAQREENSVEDMEGRRRVPKRRALQYQERPYNGGWGVGWAGALNLDLAMCSEQRVAPPGDRITYTSGALVDFTQFGLDQTGRYVLHKQINLVNKRYI